MLYSIGGAIAVGFVILGACLPVPGNKRSANKNRPGHKKSILTKRKNPWNPKYNFMLCTVNKMLTYYFFGTFELCRKTITKIRICRVRQMVFRLNRDRMR